MNSSKVKNILSPIILATIAVTVSVSSSIVAEQIKYKADVPVNITTADSVQTTYAGELKFKDGFPAKETVSKTYDFLDTARATLVFTNTIGIGSMQAMLEGQKKAGVNAFEIAIFENLLDARS